MKRLLHLAAGVLVLAAVSPANAHVTLSQTTAPAGGGYTGYFRVGHGCAGSATTALRIEIPADVMGAKPQPKAGWSLKIEHETLAAPVVGDGGRTITQRVSAITWSGGPLPDDEWDEFGLSVRLPIRAGVVAFPATQTCEQGEEHWSDVPTPGQTGHLAHPAPSVTLSPAGGGDDMMMSMPMGH
jgi:uncharacterized protein YcnI